MITPREIEGSDFVGSLSLLLDSRLETRNRASLGEEHTRVGKRVTQKYVRKMLVVEPNHTYGAVPCFPYVQ
jgi:hypothetical protein